MRSPTGAFIFIAIMLLLDTYMFQVIKSLSQSASPKTRTIIYSIYWGITVLAVIGFLLFVFTGPDFLPKKVRTYMFATIVGLFLSKVIAAIFFLVDDIRRGVQWLAGKLFMQDTVADNIGQEKISRSSFLSWLGFIAGGGLFGTLLYGFGNKYRYTVKRIKLSYDNLPVGFKGLKIIHISDIHSGSFMDKGPVAKGVQKILNEQADIILFTGDLVNNHAEEMHDYMDVFSQLKAPMGVYSTFGNHDYADYVHWDSQAEKDANLERLKKVHADLGWRLLLDENIVLKRNNDEISLIGVQNISGKARFHSYGNMAKAYTGTDPNHFKILMSHDPSHWDMEVKSKYPDVDLMLSGHTHGMQFGIEIPGFKWSPVQYVYKQWAGLYEEGKQKLYINRGYGFIGYPGRVGVLPEITVIELV
ncbi:MAG: metallophosphoesterase [Ferruginibacter sp.]